METEEQQQSTLPSCSSAISYPNIEPEKSGQDGVLMEEKDEVSRHICSQAQADYSASWEGNRPSTRLALEHAGSRSSASTISKPCCLLTFGSLLQQAAALQFSLQITHTSQIHQGSTLLFHFMFHFQEMKIWSAGYLFLTPFPLQETHAVL